MDAQTPPRSIVIGGVVIVAIAVGFWLASFMHAPSRLDFGEQARSALSDAGSKSARVEPASLPGEAAARARAANREVLELGERTLRAISDAQSELERWRSDVEPLLKNARGMLLSADPALVAAFSAAWKRSRPALYDFERATERVKDILEPVKKALGESDNTAVATAGSRGVLETEKGKAEALQAAYERDRVEIEALFSRAPANASGSLALEAAMRELVREQEDIAEADLAAKRRMAQSVAVQANFRPFLMPGYWQGSGRATASGMKRPFSFSALNSLGALSNFQQFLGLATDTRNDRITWSRPTNDDAWLAARERFKEFQQLAPIWKDMNLLSE